MSLIIPKQVATIRVVDTALKIFYDKKMAGTPVVPNKEFRKELEKAGIKAKNVAALDKYSEFLRYFGLATHDYKRNETEITKTGIDFYEAFIKGKKDVQFDIIAASILNDIFGIGADGGGNTAIQTSDSALDVPKLLVKAICDQKGITRDEFSFLISDIEKNKHSFDDACSRMADLKEKKINLEEAVNGFGKFGDPKVNVFLKTIGFCYEDADEKFQLSSYVEGKYKDAFSSIDIFNRKPGTKVYDNPNKISISTGDLKIEGADFDCLETYKNKVITEDGYDSDISEITRQNNRRPEKRITKKGNKYKLNPKLGKTQQKSVNYECEINSSHRTFETQGKNEKKPHPFMESHHLVPMKAQADYTKVNLDRTENLVCLCPNCHSQIHYGTESERRRILYVLYTKRFATLSKETSINMTANELFEKYYK